MNRFFAASLAVASIAFAGAALADDITIDSTPVVSTKTRAEVRNEFLASRQQAAALTREDSGSQYLGAQRQSGGAAVIVGRNATAQ